MDWNKHYSSSDFVGCNPVEVGKAAKARIAELERFAQWALATACGGHDPHLALSRVADEARKALATKPST